MDRAAQDSAVACRGGQKMAGAGDDVRYSLRVRSLTEAGVRDFSQVVSLLEA